MPTQHKGLKKTVHDSPQRAKLQGALEYIRAKGISEDPRDVFKFFGFKERTGYEVTKPEASPRTFHNQNGNETRGRNRKLTGADVREVDHLLEEADLGLEAKGMPWIGVIWELNLDVTPQTCQRTMASAMTYGKYPACTKDALSEKTRHDRVIWADTALRLRPQPRSWKKVRYSDEFHAGFGPEGQLRIIRKRGNGMRGRWDNIQHQKQPTDYQSIGKVHAWAAVGYNFKTPLIFYVVSASNGSITHKAYIEQILDTEVQKWIDRGDDFVQDGALGHGGGPKARKNNPVAKWFEDRGVETFFNCHNSPDLAPMRTAGKDQSSTKENDLTGIKRRYERSFERGGIT